MYKLLVVDFILASLSVGIQVDYPAGPDVRVKLQSGKEYCGEVLALRDSCVVFSLIHGADSVQLAQSKESILMFYYDAIQDATLPGASYGVTGMLIGAPSGCLTGVAIGSATTKRGSLERLGGAAAGGCAGSLAGGLIGGLIGAGASTEDSVLISATKRDFSALKPVARYKDTEPEFLPKRELIIVR